MNMKGLMAGMWLAIMILTTTGAALDAPFNAAFSTVYGQVTDGGAGVNGASVSLAANGVIITTRTITNNRGDNGFYIFELANIPNLADTTPLTLSVTTGTKSATTTITRGGNALQQVDLVPVLTTPLLTTINITPQTASLVVGSTRTFDAATRDQFGNPIDATVTWSSSNPGVGSVDQITHVFTALAAGTTVITAANGSVSGNATVTVETPVLTTITVSPPTATVVVGNTRSFGAAALDQLGNPITATVTWSSSNTTVGTINAATGVFTANAEGNTTITAASGGVSGTAEVSVVTSVLTTITVTPDIASAVVGGTLTFTAAPKDQAGNPMAAAVTWSSSNTTVGTINNTGVFTALAAGSTMIFATNGTVFGSSEVTVFVPAPPAAYRITLDPAAPVVNNPLTVTVLNNSNPTPGVLVQFVLNGGTPILGTTDIHGKIVYIPLNTGTLGIYASTVGGVPLANISVSVASVPPTAPYQITIDPALPVVNNPLTVTVLRGSTPQQGVLLQFILNGGTPVLDTTDSLGKARFIPLAPGTLSIQATTMDGLPLTDISVSVITAVPPPPPPPAPAPTLVVDFPANNQVFDTTSITVSGTASSSSGIRSVTVNGMPANGTTTWNATITLVQGTNTITVVATDNAGNTAVVIVTVFNTAQTGVVLNVAANRSSVRTGLPVSVGFTVTGNDLPVSGATVTLGGNASGSGTTDASGSVVLLVNAAGAGAITATASKPGFVSGSTNITARALETEVEPFDTDGDGRIERTEAVDCVVRFFTHGFVPGTTTPVTRTTAVGVVVTFFTQPP